MIVTGYVGCYTLSSHVNLGNRHIKYDYNIPLRTMLSRFFESQLFEIPLRQSRCAVVKVIYMLGVKLRSFICSVKNSVEVHIYGTRSSKNGKLTDVLLVENDVICSG